MKSHIPYEVAQTAFERLRNFGQSLNCGLFLATFNVTDVIPSEIGSLGQLLLAQPALFALGSNGLSQRSVDSARRQMHRSKSKQKHGLRLPTIGWYFYILSVLFLANFAIAYEYHGKNDPPGCFREVLANGHADECGCVFGVTFSANDESE
jgi:hypothetical protein